MANTSVPETAGGRAVPFVRMVKAGEEWGAQEIPLDMFGGICLICEIKIIPPAWLCFAMIGDKCAKYFKKHSSNSTNGTYYLLSSNIRIFVGTLDMFKPVFPPKNRS